MIYRFENCELDTGQVVLRRDGELISIEPQVFDVLSLLIERDGSLVSKEDILDTVWGSRFVSESALTSRVKSARRAVGDDGSRQGVIRTVHGKGYKFVATVSTVEPSERETPTSAAVAPSASELGFALPLSVNSLIGRDDLLNQLADELSETRLLTIVGPAGVGKTSIGLELARRMSGSRRDGVALVELVGVSDGDEALGAVATALDVSLRQHTSIDMAIVVLLRPKHMLLVMDNCEHLVEPIAALMEQILRAAPHVLVIATSRESLAIAGEWAHTVDPLDVSGLADLSIDELAEVPAVALFTERARAADARFELTPVSAPAVAEICRRLDGIPLALELAASRTHAIDVVEIAHRLDERLRLLRAVRRRSSPQHARRRDQLVVRPARTGRATAVHEACRFRRSVRSRRSRGDLRRRRRPRSGDQTESAVDDRSQATGVWRNEVRDAGDPAGVRARAARRPCQRRVVPGPRRTLHGYRDLDRSRLADAW